MSIVYSHLLLNTKSTCIHQDIIAEEPEMHGAMFCPSIFGTDKTTVSVATGQNDYYPLYMSPAVLFNSTRRAHRNGVVLVAFLAIPKST